MIRSMLLGLESPVAAWKTSRGSSTHACADTASITDATWSTGVISRISLSIRRNLRLAFANQKDDRRGGRESSFQPGNGNDIADSTMLGRTMLRTMPVSAATSCSPSDFV